MKIALNKQISYAEYIEQKLRILNSEYIISIWNNALYRKKFDPEGAITLSRTLLESVLKNIFDECSISYTKNMKIHELYKIFVANFEFSPNGYDEKTFKQILGGCSGIVTGLGILRNDLGDAHGRGKEIYKVLESHADLAVNLSGTMCLFLVQTYEDNKNSQK